MPVDPNHRYVNEAHKKTVHLASEGWRYGCHSEALIELADCGAEAWGEDRPCVKWARAAIAKATGEQA